MVPGDAAALLRQWFTAHLTTVGRALAWFGVSLREDRADLTQDVFFSAYLALLRGEQIEDPRAWLRECARKHASNYRRKELRRKPHTGGEASSGVHDPEQIAADRERLRRAFECLDEDAQAIVFDVRADGASWGEVARERGITIDQARYLYQQAVSQMEEALEGDDTNEKERRSIGPPIALALARIESALRAEADDVSPDTRRRIWESLEQRMEATGVNAVDPARERAESLRAVPTSRALLAPPARLQLGAMLGLVGGGIAVGIVIGYLLRGPPSRSTPAASPAGQASTPGLGAPPEGLRAALPPAWLPARLPALPPEPRLSATSPAERHDPPSISLVPRGKGTFAAARSRPASGPSSMALLDHARAALASGDTRAALALLAQHARRFPEGRDAGARRELLRLACTSPAARGAPECADVPSSAAPD